MPLHVHVHVSIWCVRLQGAAFSDEPSRELKSLHEDVIAHGCAPGLAQLYRWLPEASKKKCIQALRDSVRNNWSMLMGTGGEVHFQCFLLRTCESCGLGKIELVDKGIRSKHAKTTSCICLTMS